jgi:hypothetical protein
MADNFTRRKALTVVAAVPAGVALGASAALADASADAAVRELWQSYISLEFRVIELSRAEDEASSASWRECKTLARPWRPIGKRHDFELVESEEQWALVRTRLDTVANRDGVWHVKEFQSKPFHLPRLSSYREGEDAVRWQPYSESKSEEEVLALSKSRAEKECRSFKAKAAAISRKHGARKAKEAVNDAWEESRAVRRAIANAPATTAVARAVKIAMYLDGSEGDATLQGGLDKIEAAAVKSIYRDAVAECCFDPLADLKKARAVA